MLDSLIGRIKGNMAKCKCGNDTKKDQTQCGLCRNSGKKKPEPDGGCGFCMVCGQPLLKPNGMAGTGMCGPCCTGEADTFGEA